MKKTLLLAAGALLVVAGAAVGGLALADRDAWIARYKDQAASRAGDELGRALTVGEVESTLIPFGAKVRDVRLAGPVADGPAQVKIGELEVRFKLLAAILSFGQRLEISTLRSRGVEVRASRDAAGRWDFDDILARRAAAPDDDTPTDLSFLEGARVARAAIEDATLVLDDAALGRPLKIEELRVALEDIRLGAPLRAAGGATLVDGEARSPLSFDATLKTLPKTLSFDPLPAIEAQVKIAKLELGPWGGLFPRDRVAPARGTLDLDARVALGADLASVETKGSATTRGLVLRGPKGPASQAADLDLRWDLTRAPSGALEVREAVLKGAGVDLAATLSATRISLAGVERAAARLKIADLSRVLGIVPRGVDVLPEGLALSGPLEASLAGTPADKLVMSIDLDKARVVYDDAIDKAPGRALHAKLTATRVGDLLEVKPLSVVVDTAKIEGDLQLPLAGDAPFSATLTSGKVQLSSLKAMIPPFAAALARGDKVEGDVAFAATAKPEGGQQRLNAAFTLTGLDVNLKSGSARGRAVLRTHLKPSADKLGVEVVLDGKGLALSSVGADGSKVLDKAAGTPLNLDVALEKKGDAAEITRADVRVGETRVSGTGRITALDAEPQLDLNLGAVDLRFDDLRRAVPGASDLPVGGRLKSSVRIHGPASTDAISAQLSGLDVRFGSSRLKGRLGLARISPLEIDADLVDVDLRAGDLFTLSDSLRSLPAAARFAGSFKATGRMDRSFKAELKAKSVEIGGSTLRGTMSVRDLDRPQIAFDLQGDDVDVDAIMDAFPDDDDDAGDDNPHGLSRGARETLATVSGAGTLRAKKVRFEGLPLRSFVGKMTMTNGRVAFEALDFTFYDGRVSGAGTSLDLPAERMGYVLKLGVKGLDLNAALDAHTKLPAVFSGLVDEELDLRGQGLAKADLLKTLDGPVDLSAVALGLQSLDVLGAVFAPLAKASKKGTIASAPAGGTTLRDLRAAFQIGKGRAQLKAPVKTKTSFGALRFEGGFALDKALDLTAVAELSPATLSRWTKGRVKPAKAIPVPFKIGGTWAKPRITGVDAKALLAAAVGGAALVAADAATGGRAGEVKKQTEDRVDAAKKKIEDAKKRAEDDARRSASDAKKQVEAEARRRAADAKKKVEDAKKRAAREAKKKAEEAARKLFGK